jgi:hypothetical protein
VYLGTSTGNVVNYQNIICAVLRCSIRSDAGWPFFGSITGCFCAMNINMSQNKDKTLNLTSNNAFVTVFFNKQKKKLGMRYVYTFYTADAHNCLISYVIVYV